MFLTEVAGLPKWEYDFLNSITYASMLLFICLYSQCFVRCEVWILIIMSQGLVLVMTLLMLLNATRMNLDWGINDETLNGVIFFFGTQAVSALAYVPTQVILTYLVPENVEASTMALITGTFIWSYEVGAKISSSIYCVIFTVDDDHMSNYPNVLIAKIPVIFVMIGLTFCFIPYN